MRASAEFKIDLEEGNRCIGRRKKEEGRKGGRFSIGVRVVCHF